MDPLTQIAIGLGSNVVDNLFYSPADKFRDQLKADQQITAIRAQADIAKTQAQAQAQVTQTVTMYAVIGVVAVGGLFLLYKVLS